ncbi:hypothetical protein Q5762_14090 [Streptomyces sp. P9(2023)]|uniref:hypothetical protein n=1 Tax=Streptomyces sp. P9(2023) TaxID=3064394 RepID=UPI0028F3F793|nr:hypothetical protein [Streptomyces sp. P9(2023)]MDT9689446.1 hypothetical protein [Streptomyces sp. P9(2023)]
MEGPIFGLCVVLTSLSTAISLRCAYERRHKSTYRIARRAHLAALTACFLGSLLAIPTIADAVDRIAASNEVSSLVSDVAAVIFCASLQIMIIDWEYSTAHHAGIALRLGFACAVVGLMIWQFHRADTVHQDLSTAYAESSDVRLYLLTYLGASAAAGAEVTFRSSKLAREIRRQGRPAANGLAIASAGAAFGVAYTISRGSYLLAYENGHAWPLSWENAISPALAGLCIGCVAIGLTMATVSVKLSQRNAGSKV